MLLRCHLLQISAASDLNSRLCCWVKRWCYSPAIESPPCCSTATGVNLQSVIYPTHPQTQLSKSTQVVAHAGLLAIWSKSSCCKEKCIRPLAAVYSPNIWNVWHCHVFSEYNLRRMAWANGFTLTHPFAMSCSQQSCEITGSSTCLIWL